MSNRLLFDMVVYDDPDQQLLSVSGVCSSSDKTPVSLKENRDFLFVSRGDKGVAFSGQVAYKAIDFMPPGLFVVCGFYPLPAMEDLPCDFTVRLHSPRKTALATGQMSDGVFREKNVREFALVLSDAFDYISDCYHGIQLRCLYYKENPDLARTILSHAKMDLENCIKLFGFFPYQSLTFSPASTRWHGGCPMATGVLGLHHKPDDKVLMGNNWIITHEICHEYWGEFVKDAEPTSWLSIGLGLATDYEISMDKALHEEDRQAYHQACAEGRRTAIDIPVEEFAELMSNLEAYDYNSIVIHGKSGLIMARIKTDVGKAAFFNALSRLLLEYAGRSIDRRAFLKAIKDESGKDFGEHLDHWLATDQCI